VNVKPDSMLKTTIPFDKANPLIVSSTLTLLKVKVEGQPGQETKFNGVPAYSRRRTTTNSKYSMLFQGSQLFNEIKKASIAGCPTTLIKLMLASPRLYSLFILHLKGNCSIA
jgi:hypothetical protein